MREIRYLQSMNHRNIVKLLDVVTQRNGTMILNLRAKGHYLSCVGVRRTRFSIVDAQH